jgi:cell division protein FtsB
MRRLAILLVLLLALLAWLQYRLWFGNGGEREVADLQAQVQRQARDNTGLRERNAALAAEVQDLKSGEAAVEERARSELGMIKPGETFYRVVEPHAGSAAAPAAPASAPPPADATTGSTSASPATATSVHAADEAVSPAGARAEDAPPGLPTTDADTPPAASNDAPEPTP